LIVQLFGHPGIGLGLESNGKLEGERNRQEGITVKQASEIEGLKDAKKKCEDALKRGAEVNEAQARELGQVDILAVHPVPASLSFDLLARWPAIDNIPLNLTVSIPCPYADTQ
jgi:hypothetical protein